MKKYIFLFVVLFFNVSVFAQVNYLMPGKKLFSVKNLEMNTNHQDFGAVFYNDKVVFASTNVNAKLMNRKWKGNGLPFLDLYIADVDAQTNEFTKISQFDRPTNKKYNEGPVAFSSDYNTMIYTVNDYNIDKSADTSKLKLYISKNSGGKWQESTALALNNKNYSVGHATLTSDGKTMFFASDMPGGYGGVDIYMSNLVGGNWSKPVNLGDKINTAKDEMFPFYHKDGMLFFSSNGLSGLGGLDVFVCNISDVNNPSTPKNLGEPLNSQFDDFSFVLDNEQTKGYFTSNRTEGKGNDDIYSFTLSEKIVLNTVISGVAYNSFDNSILSNTRILIKNQDNDILADLLTNSEGEFEFLTTEENLNFSIIGSKTKFKSDTVSLTTNSSQTEYKTELFLDEIFEFNISCLIVNEFTNRPLKDVNVFVHNLISGEKYTLKTDDNGLFNIDLNNKKINDSVKFQFELGKLDFDTVFHSLNIKLDKEGEFSSIIKMKKEVVTVADIIDLNPIFFEFDKYNINSEAALELDKIVKLMNDNPEMIVEVKSYTDCKGSKRYNMRLSQKRAEATIAYIQSRISEPSRIYGKGYGEIDLNTNGACPPDNQPTPDQQLSRKTEFVIIKM